MCMSFGILFYLYIHFFGENNGYVAHLDYIYLQIFTNNTRIFQVCIENLNAIRCSSVHRANVHMCTIVALVDVLVEVFDSRDGGADLHVDVAVEEQGQVRVVGHHPAVVKGKPTPAAAAKQQLLREWCHRSINASMAA